jgi:DGQHR domain-containing protein
LEIDFIEVKQPIGSFYISSMDWADLIRIANADIRKIHEEEDNETSFDSYLGIQRTVSKKRIKEIGNYVKTIDATFPTSIILHVESESKFIEGDSVKDLDPDYVQDNFDKLQIIENIKIDENSNKLLIRKDEKVARILDGQHRIEGLREGFNVLKAEDIPEFKFNVTIFVDLDMDDQAQIFSVINKAQTKVNKSLVYDLYEYAESRSPQKTAHDIVRLLNKMEESPFYKKIKILGTAFNKETETIAQATFVELILNYISKDPMKDRDVLKRKRLFSKGKLELVKEEAELKRRFFRNLFILEKDEIIMKTLWNYFTAVEQKWKEAWNKEPRAGFILNKSTGLYALMRFLKPLINDIGIEDNEVISVEKFAEYLDKIDLDDSDFTKEIYVPGSSGQSKLYYELLEKTGLSNN